MDDKHLHIDSFEEKSSDLFSKGKIVWDKTEDDVWAELSDKLEPKDTGKSVALIPLLTKYAAAAIFILLVGLTATVFLYNKTVESLPGEHVVAELPDGTTVDLNAGSELKYYPLKWKFQRKLQFKGEGFFNVQKGKKFEVESANGITQVLGTSFNIYARDDQYRVTCLTGKVKVTSNTNESVLLQPDYHVELEKGKLILKKKYKTEFAVSWKNNQFFFTGNSLKEVIDEIERQYAVTIQLHPELHNRSFASNFPKEYNVEKVLDVVCKTMDIKYIKQSENVFLVVAKS